jgi:hypothetical protein
MKVLWSDQTFQWVVVMGIWTKLGPRLAIGCGETPDQATIRMFEDMNAKMTEGNTI